jgi:hypothetical protein
MAKSVLPIIVFFIIAIIISYLVHKKIKNYLLACVMAGILSSVIYQIIGFIVIGYLDPFYLMAFYFGTVIAFFTAMLIGFPIKKKRDQVGAEKL